MHGEEQIALVKQGFEAAMNGDYDTLRSLLTDDVTFMGPFQPEMHGVEEVIAGLRQSNERVRELGYSWEHDYEGIWADENRVVMLHHMKVSRDRQTFDTHEVQIVELRDGRACKLAEYTADPEKLSEMMSELMS